MIKTLKDLRARKTHTDSECVSKEFLIKEARNWIKELESHYGENDGKCKGFGEKEEVQNKKDIKECGHIYMNAFCNAPHKICNGLDMYQHAESSDISGAIKWIEFFFNIPDEELNTPKRG